MNSRETFSNSNEEDVLVTFYAFDYCGYCKKFQPVWDEVQSLNLPNVQYRYIEANLLSDKEKSALPHYEEPTYAPKIVLTVNGQNIEFKQQNQPMKGLDVFIRSKGQQNAK